MASAHRAPGLLQGETTTKLPLGPDELLQRGAQLKNTPWVYGLVIYTGHETKLLKNAKAAPVGCIVPWPDRCAHRCQLTLAPCQIKRSNVDDVYNLQIIYLFATLVCTPSPGLSVNCSAQPPKTYSRAVRCSSAWSAPLFTRSGSSSTRPATGTLGKPRILAAAISLFAPPPPTRRWLASPAPPTSFELREPLHPALTFFTFIILYNNLIPISLIITLDIVKYFQGASVHARHTHPTNTLTNLKGRGV